MGEKGLSVEGELQSQMTNLYEKNVPLATAAIWSATIRQKNVPRSLPMSLSAGAL